MKGWKRVENFERATFFIRDLVCDEFDGFAMVSSVSSSG
jgi:hypothetical protein